MNEHPLPTNVRLWLETAATALKAAVEWIARTYGTDTRAAHAASVPYLKLWGLTGGGWQMARAALVAAQRLAEGDGDADFYRAKIATARFYADHVLVQAPALRNTMVNGAAGVMALSEDQFLAA